MNTDESLLMRLLFLQSSRLWGISGSLSKALKTFADG